MKKKDVFTFTAPNGVEVTGVVLEQLQSQIDDCSNVVRCEYLCYAQNRLFIYYETWDREPVAIGQDEYGDDILEEQEVLIGSNTKVIVDYAILPEYDDALEDYWHQLDMADDYASKEY